MTLSWSHKLFFRVNRFVGTYPWLDRFMIFCAHWLIAYMAAALASWWYFFAGARSLKEFFIAVVISYTMSYAIGLSWRHARPIKEFPEIKELVQPLGTWKSFPSDHTIAACMIVFGAWLLGVPFVVMSVLWICAILVMVGRVYVGVHYPRDIVGGLAVSSVVIFGLSFMF